MVPFRLAKMKWADVEGVPGVSWKDEVFVLLTWPVGPTAVRFPLVGWRQTR